MSQANRLSPRRRSGRAVPVLGAAGLLVLAGSASAEASINSTMPPSGVSYPVLLGEEEIFDVSLATFNVFDKEKSNSLLPRGARGCGGGCRIGFGFGGCGGCGCAGCGLGWWGVYGIGCAVGGCCISWGGCNYC
jgi:hypothetical protein